MILPGLPIRFLGLLTLALAVIPRAGHTQTPTAVWTHLAPPSPRVIPTSGGWTVFDSRRNRFLHHGGNAIEHLGRTGNSVWSFPAGVFAIDPDARKPWSRVAPDGDFRGRALATAVYDSVSDCVWLFGGFEFRDTEYNEVWKFDLGNGTWQQVTASGAAPAPRHEAGMVLDTQRHRLLVFGGRVGPWDVPEPDQVMGDLWELTLDGSAAWRAITAPSAPSPRFGHAMVYDPVRDRVVVCSGEGSDSLLSDAWAFDAAEETWSVLTPGGLAPAGPLVGVLDRENDRMLAIAPGDPVSIAELPINGTAPWVPVDAAGSDGVSWDPSLFNRRVAAAWGGSPRGLLLLWERVDIDVPARDAAYLRFPPLAPLVLSISPAGARYTMRTGSLDWSVTSDRPLYDRVRLRVTSTPVPQPDGGDGFVTDSPDTFTILQDVMEPETHYAYRATWFDGVAERDTNFIIETPPHPTDIGFAFEGFDHWGYDVKVRFAASDDSARMLSTQSLERRIPPGLWETIWPAINLPAQGTWAEAGVIPDTVYEYRVRWGDPAANHFATASVRTLPRPQRISSLVTSSPLAVDIVWSIRPGSVFQGMVHRYHTGGDGDEPVGSFEVNADASGSIVLHDTDVRPNQRYAYPLEWNVGGLLIGDYGIELLTPPAPPPPPPPTQNWIARLDVVNPGRDQIEFNVALEGPSVSARIHDIGGRLRWYGTIEGAGEHPFRLGGSSWPAGIYLVRIEQGNWTRTKRIALLR